jgi:hypothetical protein
LEADAETLTGTPQEYSTTIIEGGNKLAKRTRRMEILRDILDYGVVRMRSQLLFERQT